MKNFIKKLKYKLFKSWFIRKQIKYINNNIKSIISDFDLYNNKKFKILSYKEVELLKDKMNFFQHAKDLIKYKNTIYSCEYFTIQYNIYKIDIIFSALEDDYYFVRIEIGMNLELGQPEYNFKEIYCLEIDQLSNLKRFLDKIIINK